MRCLACNVELSDFEATRKYESGEFVDLCNHCFNESDFSGIVVLEREDLKDFETLDEEFFDGID